MAVHGDSSLSKRENQVMDILYRLKSATAAQVQEQLPEAPNNSSVRSLLSILVEKGLLKVRPEGKRYIYEPTDSPVGIRQKAVGRLLATFFSGSPRELVASLLDPKESQLSKEEIANLRKILDQHPEA